MCTARSLWRFWLVWVKTVHGKRKKRRQKKNETKEVRSERWLTVSSLPVCWLRWCCFYSFFTLLHAFFSSSRRIFLPSPTPFHFLLHPRAHLLPPFRTSCTRSLSHSFYVSDYCIFDYVCTRVGRFFSLMLSLCRCKYFFHIVAIATIVQLPPLLLPTPILSCSLQCIYDLYHNTCDSVVSIAMWKEWGEQKKIIYPILLVVHSAHSIRYMCIVYIF